jgi:ABC-type ATPase involved in cell division
LLVASLEHLRQALGLCYGPWKAIQNKSTYSVGLIKSLVNHAEHQRIRNQLALVHVGLRLKAKRCPIPYGGSQQVAARDLRRLQLRFEHPRLCAFAGAGRTQ